MDREISHIRGEQSAEEPAPELSSLCLHLSSVRAKLCGHHHLGEPRVSPAEGGA